LIDLLLVNPALLELPLSPLLCDVSFSLSFGSDHAGLLYSFHLPRPYSHPTPCKGWIIDDTKQDEWAAFIRDTPIPNITSPAEAHLAAEQLEETLRFTADSLFDKRHQNTNGKYPWWNEECRIAAAAIAGASGNARTQKRLHLWKTLRDAKQSFFETLLTDTSTPIWDVAKWRHGRRESLIHPIISPSGTLTTDFDSMTHTFKDRFFNIVANGPTGSASQALSEVPNSLGTASTIQLRLENGERVLRHPPAEQVNLATGCPLPGLSGALLQTANSGGPSLSTNRRSFFHVTKEEVRQALSTTSNKSAPGPSGITYKLLKWTFAANPDLIITTLNGALEQGTHPWGTADVVVIPKPNKPDYSLAKAYRPISLLECTGKLLEKIVANRLGADERNFSLIGPMQFGSRKYHSAPNAATLLRFKAQTTIRSGNVGGILLLDISRFFDHLNPTMMVTTLADLGVDAQTCAWVHSFMTERTLRLTFNGDQSDPFRQDVGVPQGSPLSPILSTLYTSPVLREALSSGFGRT
jgi:hypothetical protein